MNGERSREANHDRRELLKGGAKFAGVLAALGISGEAWLEIVGMAQAGQARRLPARRPPDRLRPAEKQKLLGDIVWNAMKTQDMEATLERYRDQLSPEEQKVLGSVTREELRTLNAVIAKLKPLAPLADCWNVF